MSTFGKVLLFFIILAWAGFFVLAATVLKTQDLFRTQYETVKTELALKEQWASQLGGETDPDNFVPDPKYFDPNKAITVRTASGQTLTITPAELRKMIDDQRDGVLQAVRAINDALADRGRWWPNVQPQVNAQGVATLTLPGPPNLTEGASQNTVFVFEAVQAFDAPVAPGTPANLTDLNGRRTRYVGEFKVQSVNGNVVTLEPAMPLTDAEKQLIVQSAQSGAPWNLYETMPTDSYAPLADATEADIAALIDASLVQMYLQHGQPANEEIHAPEQIFVLVEFQKDFADLSQEQKTTLESNAWMFKPYVHENIDGQPLVDAQGAPVTVNVAEIVAKGTRARFNLPTANTLTSMTVGGDQLATEVPPNPARPEEGKFIREYWRPLNDYWQIFRRFYAQRPIMLHRLAELNTDNKSMAESIKNLQSHLAAREQLKAALDSDSKRLTEEKDIVTAYQDGLQARTDALAAAIADLRRKNQDLVQELDRLQLERKRQLEEGIASAPEAEPAPAQPAGDRTAGGRRP